MRSDSWPRKCRGEQRYGDVAHLALRNGRHVTAKWQARPSLGHEHVLAWWVDDDDAIDDSEVVRWLVQTKGDDREPWNLNGDWLHGEQEPWTIGEVRRGYRVTMD